MSAPRRRRVPHQPRLTTANEAWKAQWNDCLAWSTMLAVAAHAAAFAFSPGWDPLDVWAERDLELLGTGTSWVSLDAAPSSDGRGATAVASGAPLQLQEPDSLPAGVDAGARIGGPELATLAFSGGLRERLLGRGGPIPTIVEPDRGLDRESDREIALPPASPALDDDPPDALEPDTHEEDRQGEGIRVIVESPTLADPAFRLETSTLNLSRMAGITPELFMPGTSAWLLIRNPADVEEYMKIVGYEQYMQGTAAQGLVNVAVWIDDRGSVEWSEVSKSSGRVDMDEAALALFSDIASFRPARDQGVRVSMSVIFSVEFPW